MSNMGNRETALKNLSKRKSKGGRPKDTVERKAKKLAFLQVMRDYLESGEFLAEFEAAKRKKPLEAIEMARDSVYGRPKQVTELSGDRLIVRVDNTLKSGENESKVEIRSGGEE